MALSSSTSAFLSSLVFIGVSIFFFLQENEGMGRLFLVLAAYVFVLMFFLLKAMYYMKYKATFNVAVFVFLMPISPILLVALQKKLLEPVMYSDMIFASIQMNLRLSNNLYRFNSITLELLIVPIYYFSLFLVMRTHLRYPVIRLKGHKKTGFSPRFTGFLLTIIIPLLYLIFALTFENMFFMIFGVLFFIVSISAMFV